MVWGNYKKTHFERKLSKNLERVRSWIVTIFYCPFLNITSFCVVYKCNAAVSSRLQAFFASETKLNTEKFVGKINKGYYSFDYDIEDV